MRKKDIARLVSNLLVNKTSKASDKKFEKGFFGNPKRPKKLVK
ncbi:hypothetical protein [Chengkuizengella axinellae]|uniref:Cyclic lactone autoinducer peptide n=1 Tax=Chengkuizengella axinellae TaxID=3064388 RepID=A0ABT9IYD3_9BACL|nr:hypothetical protein [Chengkuizengella sp. 2205SS18-9]MDP5274376.1 hypothetical protein [Chengkuizengella sp. 2205SS18-9]